MTSRQPHNPALRNSDRTVLGSNPKGSPAIRWFSLNHTRANNERVKRRIRKNYQQWELRTIISLQTSQWGLRSRWHGVRRYHILIQMESWVNTQTRVASQLIRNTRSTWVRSIQGTAVSNTDPRKYSLTMIGNRSVNPVGAWYPVNLHRELDFGLCFDYGFLYCSLGRPTQANIVLINGNIIQNSIFIFCRGRKRWA